jgi:hypothetical protein
MGGITFCGSDSYWMLFAQMNFMGPVFRQGQQFSHMDHVQIVIVC